MQNLYQISTMYVTPENNLSVTGRTFLISETFFIQHRLLIAFFSFFCLLSFSLFLFYQISSSTIVKDFFLFFASEFFNFKVFILDFKNFHRTVGDFYLRLRNSSKLGFLFFLRKGFLFLFYF